MNGIEFFKTLSAVGLLFFLLTVTVFSQSFTAETHNIFIGEPKGNFFGTIKIISGVLKVGEEATIYAETGRKFNIKILKMSDMDQNPLKQAKAGEIVWIEFFTSDETMNGTDYLRNGYKIYPKNFVFSAAKNPPITTTDSNKRAVFQTMLDGKIWKANVTKKGASYWRKGVKNLIEKPYLQLSLGAIDGVDTRALVFQIFYPKESPAVYSEKDMEVNFSGTVDGKRANTTIYGFINGKADTKFTVEITKWQTVSKTKAIISGKIYGELREVAILGKPTKVNKFENGVFDDIEIEIFNEQPDFNEMMKEATKKRN